MTLAEKFGQLQLVNTEELARAALAATPCGGMFSVVGAATLNAVQKVAVEQTRLGIPLIFGLDVIHGYTTNFPIPLGQASSFDPGVAHSDAVISAAEARRSGITWTYAPMMDVTHEPRWGRIAEGNGEDPYLTSQLAVAKVQGYQGTDYSAPDKVAACMKHYVAYGGTEGGRDYNTVDVSIQELHNHYLPPFKAAVDAGVATAMASFNTVAGVPAHANRYTIARGAQGHVRLRRVRGQRLHRHPGTDHARRRRQRRRRRRGRDQRRRRHGDGVHQLRRLRHEAAARTAGSPRPRSTTRCAGSCGSSSTSACSSVPTSTKHTR